MVSRRLRKPCPDPPTCPYIVLGQPIGQRADVSKEIASELAGMFPAVRRIAANIAEFEKATYFNREML